MNSKPEVAEDCFFDTHAHLQWKDFDGDREAVIGRAREAGVSSIVNIGFDIASSLAGIKLAEKYEGLFATVGIHPHNADKLNEHVLDQLRHLCESPKVVAVGEIGLDYYRNLSPQTAQKRAFEAQLVLAEELRLPVIIHDRNAHSDVLSILSKRRSRTTGIMHCFSGDRQMAQKCIDLNFLLSFTGAVTFPKSRELVEIAKWAGLDKIIVETDCPWLAPQEVRGKRNEPSFLVHTARKIAELRDIPMSELAKATTRNARKAFHLI